MVTNEVIFFSKHLKQFPSPNAPPIVKRLEKAGAFAP